MYPVNNEKGYQLLEIILSISLLTIVLMVFFGYILQAKTFNNKNGMNGTASQLSQEVLEEVRSPNITPDKLNMYTSGTYSTEVNNQLYYINVQIKPALDHIKEYQENNSYVTSLLFLDPLGLLDLLEKLTKIEITANMQNLQFIQVEIIANQNGNQVKVYETYGYKRVD